MGRTYHQGEMIIRLPGDESLPWDQVTVTELPDDDLIVRAFEGDGTVNLVCCASITVPESVLDELHACGGEGVIVPRTAPENTVTLIEHDGIYVWTVPAASDAPITSDPPVTFGPPATSGAPGTPADPDPAAIGGIRTVAFRRPSGTRPAALIGSGRTPGLPTRVRAAIFRLPSVAAAALVRTVETAIVHPGLITITDQNPLSWRRFRIGDVTPPATPGVVRVLLLVHGTFVTTVGGFGVLESNDDAKAFLDSMLGRYDAVLGFTHRTLSESPKHNADELRQALASLAAEVRDRFGGATLAVDVVTHSRGALVARSFVELTAPVDGVGIEKLIMVAGPNAGTLLAAPTNWRTLLDLWTALAADVARQWAGPIAENVTRESLSLVAACAKAVIAQAVDAQNLPGLASMRPSDNPFLDELNAPGGGAVRPPYRTVVTDFEPDQIVGPQNPVGDALERLADDVVDPLMGTANDLVVNTDSMSEIDGTSLPGPSVAIVPSSTGTQHLSYFVDRESLRMIEGELRR